MAIAGTLTVNVIAQTLGFTKPLGKARKQLSTFGKGVKTLDKGLAALGLRIAAVAGPAALGALVLRQSVAMDSMAKLSERLGFNAEELQFYSFAAKRAGVQTSTLTMAIQRMERRIGEAATGQGEAVKLLKEWNVNAKELADLAPHKQFEFVLDKLRGITNQNDKLRQTFKLFDSEGVALAQLLNQDLEVMRENFEALGGARSKKDLAAATAFIDSWTNLKQAGGAAIQKLVVDVAPGLTKVIEFITSSQTKFEQGAMGLSFLGTEERIGRAKMQATPNQNTPAFFKGKSKLPYRPTARQLAARAPQPRTPFDAAIASVIVGKGLGTTERQELILSQRRTEMSTEASRKLSEIIAELKRLRPQDILEDRLRAQAEKF